MNILRYVWPFSAIGALTDENTTLKRRVEELQRAKEVWSQVDLETDRIKALEQQVMILGDKAKDHDMMCAELRRLRVTLRDMYPTDLTHAEETRGTSLIDLAIWILRGKPGPKGFEKGEASL